MEMHFDGVQKIGDMVTEFPKAADIFKSYGIDFCCGGNRTLADTAGKQHLPLESILASLAATQLFTLHKVSLTEEQNHLRFYFNDIQFLAIPLFDDERTGINEDGENGSDHPPGSAATREEFVSFDRDAN